MNVARFLFVVLGLLSACGEVFSRAIPADTEEASHRISKRSSSADHNINQARSRHKATHLRQLFLARIFDTINTSGLATDSTPPFAGSGLPATTTTTRLRNFSDGSGDHFGSKHRKGKRGKGKKRRNRRRKKNRKNRRSRRVRSLADDIVNLLEGVQGEDVLNAIAHVVGPDPDFSQTYTAAEEIVRSSAKKCECKKSRKANLSIRR